MKPMRMPTPTTLDEAIVSLIATQGATTFLQGQLNLLLGFVTTDPENKKGFAQYVKHISELEADNIEEMKFVAQQMIGAGFAKDLEPPPSKPPSGDTPSPESNVLQFPKLP
jgi:hypothetical protein